MRGVWQAIDTSRVVEHIVVVQSHLLTNVTNILQLLPVFAQLHGY